MAKKLPPHVAGHQEHERRTGVPRPAASPLPAVPLPTVRPSLVPAPPMVPPAAPPVPAPSLAEIGTGHGRCPRCGSEHTGRTWQSRSHGGDQANTFCLGGCLIVAGVGVATLLSPALGLVALPIAAVGVLIALVVAATVRRREVVVRCHSCRHVWPP